MLKKSKLAYFKYKHYGKPAQDAACVYMDDFIWVRILDYVCKDVKAHEISLKNGDEEYIDYLENLNVGTAIILKELIKYDQLDGFIYMINKHNIKLTKQLCVVAVSSLRILTYLHEEAGCPWNESTMDAAAAGWVDSLTYAHEKGCPWGVWSGVNATLFMHKSGNRRCLDMVLPRLETQHPMTDRDYNTYIARYPIIGNY